MWHLAPSSMATDRDVDVPDPEHPRIVADDTFGGEPRIRGRRITVLDVYEAADDPETFAHTFDLDLTDVHAALAYYYAHEAEMERHRRARERASKNLRARVEATRPPGVDPDG